MGTKFLESMGTKIIKHKIKNILDSYSHPWDILAELCQNSVDAINKWNDKNACKREHSIEIKINSDNREISIQDTGYGISPQHVPILLAPDSTDKTGSSFIGQKGVGLTFCIFSSNLFKIETCCINGTYSGEIHNASAWVSKSSNDNENQDIPEVINEKITNNESSPIQTYTRITLSSMAIPSDVDLFTLTLERLEYLLRTKTAIGHTGSRFKKSDLNVLVKLKKIESGKEHNRTIKFGYFFPEDFFKKGDVVNIDQFMSIAGQLNDKQKNKQLTRKCLVSEGTRTSNGSNYHYYAFYMSSRTIWKDIAKKNKLLESPDKDINDIDYNDIDLSSGIFISTRGMPTGIMLPPPTGGEMTYWENQFIIIENDSLVFDYGRKSFGSKYNKIIKDIAKENFAKFAKWRTYLGHDSKTPDVKLPEISQIHRDSEFEKLKKIPKLNFDKILFDRCPDGQEASVVAIFHELVGANILKGYCCMATGYRKTYDFWGYYKISKDLVGVDIQKQLEKDCIDKTLVIEFKFNGASIFDDLKDNTKYIIDIDLIVCWDIDQEKLSKESCITTPLMEKDVFYFGSNYFIEFPASLGLGQNGIKPVLALKRYIEDQIRQIA